MKIVPQITAAEAARLVPNGAVIMAGGFGMTGNPVHLFHALAELPITDLTLISNNVGEEGLGGGRLLHNGQLKRAIGSFFTSNRAAVAAAQSGKLEVELIPQGTLAEAIRAGGAGIGGFYIPPRVGKNLTQKNEKKRDKWKKEAIFSAPPPGVAFIPAYPPATAGNLVYRMTERNFNPLMSTAAELGIA